MKVEKIQNEFCEIVCSTNFSKQLMLHQNEFLQMIPELKDLIGFQQNNPYHVYDVWEHTIHAIENCESKELIVRLAVFFHDFGKPHCYQDGKDGIRHFKGHGRVSADIADVIMKRMKLDKTVRESVVELVCYHDATFSTKKKCIKRWLNKMGLEQFKRLLHLRTADIKGHKPDYDENELRKILQIEKSLEEILLEAVQADESGLVLADLAVNGKDLMKIGYQADERLGAALRKLLSYVKKEGGKNERSVLLELAKEWIKKE